MPLNQKQQQAILLKERAGQLSDEQMGALRRLRASGAFTVDVDTETGVDPALRARLGFMKDEASRLAALQKRFPGAVPDPRDPGNFLIPDKKTGNLILFNPEGADVGDIPSLGREAVQTAMATAGGAAGVPLGPGGIAAGSAAGSMAGDLVSDIVSRLFGNSDLRSPGEQAGDIALTGGMNAAGGALGGAAAAGPAAAVRGVFRGGAGGREAAREAQEAATDLTGSTAGLSVGQVTRNRVSQAVEAALSRFPGSAGRIAEVAKRANQKIGDAVLEAADLLAGPDIDPEQAGRAIQRGIDIFAERFRARSGALYDEMNQHIPPAQPVAVTRTASALTDMTVLDPAAPAMSKALANPRAVQMEAALVEDAPQGAVPFSVLQRMRTDIGQRLSDPRMIEDLRRGELKQLYAAITEDMKAAAEAAGPDALRAFNRANNYYRAGVQRVDRFLSKLNDAKIPERVFKALESSGREGATVLREIRKSLPEHEWRIVASAVVRRLGRAKPGQLGEGEADFSLGTFLTNWRALDPQARAALFRGPGMGDLGANLDKVALIAERAREAGGVFANPSGTSQGLMQQGAVLGGVGALASAATGQFGDVSSIVAYGALAGLSTNLTARLMTSPSFIRWLAQTTKIKPENFPAHLGRLAGTYAANNDDTRGAVKEYLSIFAEAKEVPEVEMVRQAGDLNRDIVPRP